MSFPTEPMIVRPTLRTMLGCWWHERWDAERVLLGDWVPTKPKSWLDLRNRGEQLLQDDQTGGRLCQWSDSSPLTAAKVFPDLGRRLFRHVNKQWPMLLDSPTITRSDNPDVSVIIAIGGTDRLKQFQLSLRSVLCQRDASFEVIIVEQSSEPRLGDTLPEHVVYCHQQVEPSAAFNKSRALNGGADLARGGVLAIHDGDFLLPSHYLASCLSRLQDAAGLRPVRWVIHFDEATTSTIFQTHCIPDRPQVESILQNTPNPMLCRKSAYHEIGGHDESFVGWGGEDLEFLSRLRTLPMLEGGFLPVAHLWHPPAKNKTSGDRNQSLQDQRLSQSPEERITRLTSNHQRESSC